MNPNTMTAQECADWCAMDDWWRQAFQHRHASGAGQWWWERDGGDESFDHPHPLTLDGAAKALPEGWSWTKHATSFGKWWAAYPPGWNGEEYPEVVDTGDEIADRYRLAVACRMAMKEQA